MMPMRRAVLGKTPMEIVALQAEGALEGDVSMEDFAAALEKTPPSTSAAETAKYEAWEAEYGSK